MKLKLTLDRLKPCKFCKQKPGIRLSGDWSFVGCVNEKCDRKPGTWYLPGQGREVFENWNFHGGDVNIRDR